MLNNIYTTVSHIGYKLEHTICISTDNNNYMYVHINVYTFITEYLLIWLQPLELTYLYLLQKNYIML